MENYYAKSPIIGRKSHGVFYGLQFNNASKDYKIQIFAVTWQVWAVDVYNNEGSLRLTVMIHQTSDELPTFEIRNTSVYKHGLRYKYTGAEVYSNK